MRLVATALAIFALALAGVASAHDGQHEPGSEHDTQASAAPADSPDAALSPEAQIAAAKQRLDQAEAAYTLMVSRKFPRGDARGKIIEERQKARAEWERVSAAYPDLIPPADAN